ncbi:uncharacterized protein LOC108206069 isoform X3 [Daucus carota subsp. sativus]|uniref:uncharacterized protein LOC108206069 isoform X3 n=1 Tax=Daucus carota subsp. sativus TaxID=79200 RepID=UPI003083B360
MGFAVSFVFDRLFGLFHKFCFVVSTYMLPLFDALTTYFSRLDMKNDSVEHSSSTLCETNDKIVSRCVNEKQEKGLSEDVLGTGFLEKEPSEFALSFRFPTYDEFIATKRGNGEFVSSEAIPSASIDKYHLSEKSFSGEPVTFSVEEKNAEVNDVSFESKYVNDEEECLSDRHLNVSPLEVTEESMIRGVTGQELNEKNERVSLTRDRGDDFDEEYNSRVSEEIESTSMDSDFRWIGTDGFLSEKDFGKTFDLDYLINVDDKKAGSSDELSDFDESLASYNGDGEDSDIVKELRKLEEHMDGTKSDSDESRESYDFEGEDSDIMEELRELEDGIDNNDKITSNHLSHKNSDERSNNSNQGEVDKCISSAVNSEHSESKNRSPVETEDTNKLETLWEHQDLVEQLKMELKKVRASGLPTILEDFESPKIMEDLKPWKIEEKFQHQNPMGELNKFYKSYRERMRKLDVLTYQKMYAIGQMCLSWDFLHWQYGIALDIWDSDPRGIRHYNEVAGEFQQFQVLVQRFIEDEPFQGPRVQNYIKHRCVFRDFLQIPVIRDDKSNVGKKGKGIQRGDYVISSDMLVEILEESIRLFWRFVRADKQCTHANRRQKATLVDPQEPAASVILSELQKDLQKKARKLKDQMRSSHCILKKFRNCQEEDSSSSNQVLFFFSQVDLKLVSRVLSMSKLTMEQLAWCRSKLSSISFINRKVHVEPSFSLFPC